MKQQVIFQEGKWFGDSKVGFLTVRDTDAFCVLLKETFGNRLEEKELSRTNNVVQVSSAIIDSDVVLIALKAFLYDYPQLEYEILYTKEKP